MCDEMLSAGLTNQVWGEDREFYELCQGSSSVIPQNLRRDPVEHVFGEDLCIGCQLSGAINLLSGKYRKKTPKPDIDLTRTTITVYLTPENYSPQLYDFEKE